MPITKIKEIADKIDNHVCQWNRESDNLKFMQI